MFPKKLKEENYDYWKDYSIMSNRFIVFFGEHVLDLTQFLLENPKGFPFFNNYALMNIEPLFTKKKKQDEDICKLLLNYNIGKILFTQSSKKKLSKKVNSPDKNQFEKDISNTRQRKVTFQKQEENNQDSRRNKMTFSSIEHRTNQKENEFILTRKSSKKRSKVEFEEKMQQIFDEQKPELKIPNIKINIFPFHRLD